MQIFVEFIFRLPFIYRIFDIEVALLFKHKMRKFLNLFFCLLFFFYLLYIRNFYITFLLFSSILVSAIDSENNGLVVELHEQGIFGNWKSTLQIVDFIVFFIFFIHLFFGPFGT